VSRSPLETGAGKPGFFERRGIALAAMGRIDDRAGDALACYAFVAERAAATLNGFGPGAVEGVAQKPRLFGAEGLKRLSSATAI
jgi:hypothetical protein